MRLCEVNAEAIASGQDTGSKNAADPVEPITVTTEFLSQTYPMFASSLFNLIKNSEKHIDQKISRR